MTDFNYIKISLNVNSLNTKTNCQRIQNSKTTTCHWYLWKTFWAERVLRKKNSCQDWKVHFLPLSGREISKLMTGLSSFAKLTVPMSHQLVTCTISVSISSRHWQLVFPKLRFGGDCPNMIYLGVVFQFILLLAPKHINILLFVII